CPGQPGRQSDFAFSSHALLAKLDRPKHAAHALSVNDVFEIFRNVFRYKATRQLAATRSNFAFEITHTGFAGVVANDLEQSLVRKVKLLWFQTVTFSLLRHQMPLRDFQLFFFGIAG